MTTDVNVIRVRKINRVARSGKSQGKHKFFKVRKKSGCFASSCTNTAHELSDSSKTGHLLICLTKFFDKNNYDIQSIPFIYLFTDLV